jgi:hypothetical protein
VARERRPGDAALLGGDAADPRSGASEEAEGPLDACPDATVPASVDTCPNLERCGRELYVRTDDVRLGMLDGVSDVDSGYHLDHLLLVLLEGTAAGRLRLVGQRGPAPYTGPR